MARVAAKAEAAAREATPDAEVMVVPTSTAGSAWMGEARGTEAVPELGGNMIGQTVYPKVKQADAYWLVFHERRWDVMHGLVVPMLSKLSATVGTNGVERTPSGKPQPAPALAEAVAKGGIVIQHNVDGPGRSYLKRIKIGEGRNRRTNQPVDIESWHSRWEKLYPGSEAIDTDEVAYAKWCRWLVDSGKLPQPREYVLEHLASEKTKLIGRHKAKGQGNGPLVAKYEADLKAVQAELAKLRASAVPIDAPEAAPDL